MRAKRPTAAQTAHSPRIVPSHFMPAADDDWLLLWASLSVRGSILFCETALHPILRPLNTIAVRGDELIHRSG